MTLRYYVQALRKRWLTILVLVLVGVAAALGITRLMKPSYQTAATCFVHLSGASNQSAQFAESQIQSYPDVVDSPSVLAPVISQLHLDMTVPDLAGLVSASNPTGTFLLSVQATSGSALQAQQIANAVAQSLATEIDKLESADSAGPSPVTVTVTTPAGLPSTPVSPRPTLNLILGLLAGLAVGICVAIVKDQLDLTVKSTDDLKRLSGASPLGTIRNDSEFQAKPLVSTHEHSSGIEDFRSIRTNLQFVDVDNPPKQIVVCSAVANEGKTIAACNIATTMAQADLRVCLVEGDLRRPRATAYLGLDGTIGLTDAAAGTHDLDDVLIPWHRGQITVLPAGTTPPDPAQFLGSKAMSSLLDQLRQRFDVVIIDAPPLLPVSDGAVLGALSDGVILIARHRHVRRDQFSAAIAALHAVNATVLGSVLTRVPTHRRHGYYAEYRTTRRRGKRRRQKPAAQVGQVGNPLAEPEPTTSDETTGPLMASGPGAAGGKGRS